MYIADRWKMYGESSAADNALASKRQYSLLLLTIITVTT